MKIESGAAADIATLLNGFTGLLAIMYIIDGNIRLGMVLILAGIIIDGADGTLARLFGRRGGHGIYLDSIADMVTFCFAPSILLYAVYYDLSKGTSFENLDNALAVMASMLVVLFGIMRLARFIDRGYRSKTYMGLPTPAAALFIVSAMAVVDNWIIVLLSSVAISFLMISRINYPKLRDVLGWIAAFVVVTGILSLLFPSVYSDFTLVFVMAMAIVYVVIGPLYAERCRSD